MDWQQARQIAVAAFNSAKRFPGVGELKTDQEAVLENDDYYLFQSEFTPVLDERGEPVVGYGPSRIVVNKRTGEVGALSSSIPARFQLDGLQPISV